jgi:drug/metabolite transporter (DMT)-like permease
VEGGVPISLEVAVRSPSSRTDGAARARAPRPRVAAAGARDAVRAGLLTGAALACFAANSLLCRAALRPRLVDAATFTLVRVASGAAVVAAFALARSRGALRSGSWGSAAALFAYAATFSLAYVRIHAGVGALLLFAAVQAAMLGWSLRRGTRLRGVQWLGVAIAAVGLALLTLPGATAPDAAGAALMVAAGVAWAVYSIRGRAEADPLATTAGNFVRALPLAAALAAAAASAATATGAGLALAAVSGGVTSGGGYVLWYAALPALGAARAGTLQLAVPVLAAAAGVALLGEPLTPRLVASSAAILAGLALALRAPSARGGANERAKT